jgi:hypothetical protein
MRVLDRGAACCHHDKQRDLRLLAPVLAHQLHVARCTRMHIEAPHAPAQMPPPDIPVTATMSISKRGSLSCEEVAGALWKSGVIADVSENISTRPWIEEGCRITMEGRSKAAIAEAWFAVKGPFALSCAHLNIAGTYQGCIHDFLRPSVCPGRPADDGD